MTEHVHEWRTTRMENGELSAVCQDKTCGMGMMLSASQVDIRLNRYEKLRKATESLSAELALTALHYVESGGGKMGDALRAYADILEGK